MVDASALAFSILGSSPGRRSLRQRLSAETCHAPHLVDAEIGNVLRRRVLRGELGAPDAQALLLAAAPLIDHRYEMTGRLGQAAWALRENLSFYDALYVALAQALSVPLLTGDGRLSRAPALPCAVELTTGAG
ncbi:MAG: type II toxin-antitoxin system VapC family toxin [Actinomycetota bacterium]|nr:type II toxin-antitoxin system VapC family toxin [Actinomycetota bacterium]